MKPGQTEGEEEAKRDGASGEPGTPDPTSTAQEEQASTAEDQRDDPSALTHEELLAKYQDAVRGISEKGEELSGLKRQHDTLAGQLQQVQSALSNPQFLKALLATHEGGNGKKAQDTLKEVAEASGLDEDILQRLDRYLEVRGVLRRGDQMVNRFEQVLTALTTDRVGGLWKDLVADFPDAKEMRPEIEQLVQKTGGVLTLEEAYHALTKGKARKEADATRKKEDLDTRKRAQLLRPHSREPIAPVKKESDRGDLTTDDLMGIVRDLKLDPKKLFGDNVLQ